MLRLLHTAFVRQAAPLVAARTVRAAIPRAVTARAVLPQLAVRAYATERDGSVSIDNPAAAEAQQLLEQGTSALEVGDFEKAKADYRASLRVHKSASAHYNLGVVMYQERAYDCSPDDLAGAIAEWTEALAIAPDSPDAHTNIASAYIMSKPSRPDLAVSHLRCVDADEHRV